MTMDLKLKKHLKNYHLKSNIKLFDSSTDSKLNTVGKPFMDNSMMSNNNSLYHSKTNDQSLIDEKFQVGRNSSLNDSDDKYNSLAN